GAGFGLRFTGLCFTRGHGLFGLTHGVNGLGRRFEGNVRQDRLGLLPATTQCPHAVHGLVERVLAERGGFGRKRSQFIDGGLGRLTLRGSTHAQRDGSFEARLERARIRGLVERRQAFPFAARERGLVGRGV